MTNANEVNVQLDSQGKPFCDPDRVDAQGRNATITFRLLADGYAFRSQNAIVVQNGGDQFPDPSRTENHKIAKLKDLNSASGTFKYSVFLKRDSTGEDVEIDPEIKNNP